MKIQNVNLRNFRKFEDIKISFNKNFNILIGNNGAGKTTVLDALAILLNTYFQGSRIVTGGGSIKASDVRSEIANIQGQAFQQDLGKTSLTAKAVKDGDEFFWVRETGDRGGKAKDFVKLGQDDRAKHDGGKKPILPLLLYYGAGRLWDVHANVETGKPESQLAAYRYCLDPKSDLISFEKWFKKLYFVRLQKGEDIPALDAVKKAVIECVPGALDFYHDTSLDKIVLKLRKEGLVPFDYLSDGYQNMIAMVADIAHRASRLNPDLGINSAKNTPGVILIDELDLHLHPKWQRRVVADLKRTFENIQFIATTHSPFIIQSIKQDELINLDPHGRSDAPDEMSLSKVVTDIMQIESIRSDDFDNRVSNAQNKLGQIQKENGKLTVEDYSKIREAITENLLSETNDPEFKAFLLVKNKKLDLEGAVDEAN